MTNLNDLDTLLNNLQKDDTKINLNAKYLLNNLVYFRKTVGKVFTPGLQQPVILPHITAVTIKTYFNKNYNVLTDVVWLERFFYGRFSLEEGIIFFNANELLTDKTISYYSNSIGNKGDYGTCVILPEEEDMSLVSVIDNYDILKIYKLQKTIDKLR